LVDACLIGAPFLSLWAACPGPLWPPCEMKLAALRTDVRAATNTMLGQVTVCRRISRNWRWGECRVAGKNREEIYIARSNVIHFQIRKPMSCVVTKPEWLCMSTTEKKYTCLHGRKRIRQRTEERNRLERLGHPEYKRMAHRCTSSHSDVLPNVTIDARFRTG